MASQFFKSGMSGTKRMVFQWFREQIEKVKQLATLSVFMNFNLF